MTKTKVNRFWSLLTPSKFRGLRLRRMRKVLKSVFPFRVFPFVRYKILLRFSIILYFVPLFLLLFSYLFFKFFAEKTMFSFQTLLKGTFSLLTCHLQFSITARVSMTLKRQSVQSLSDPKAACTFCVSQERGIVKRMFWSKTKWPFRSLLCGAGGWGVGGGGGAGESE